MNKNQKFIKEIKMIKTIIFDLGGVYFTDGTERAINIITETYGLEKNAVADVFKGEIGTKYRKSEITHEEFWNLAKQTLGINAETSKLAEIWLSGYVPIDGTVKTIQNLKNNGYGLFVWSDNVQGRMGSLTAR